MLTSRAARSPGSRPRSRSGFPGRLTHPLAGACLLAGTVALAAAAALAHLTWRLLPQTLAHLERANDEPRMVDTGPPPFPETARYLARMAVTWRVLQTEGTLPQRWPLWLALLDHAGALRNALAAAGAALGLVALVLGWPRLATGWKGVPALGREVERA